MYTHTHTHTNLPPGFEFGQFCVPLADRREKLTDGAVVKPVCMCVCVCVCVCVSMYVCMHACMYVCMCR